jgi:GrpB-like predicted nucleotidyltransferase (UPF0157 family)/RimJ/RimL family protein N-acetyltransferase
MKLREHNIALQGERVILRPMTEHDWDILLRWNSDPEVLYYSEGNDVAAYNLEQVQGIYRQTSQTAFCFIVEVAGEPVGECWLQEMNLARILEQHPGQDCRRIDLMIGEKDRWGCGYGTDMIRTLTRFGFEQEGADRIYGCEIGDYNPRSLRAFLKAGYRVEAQVQQPPGQKARYEYDVVLTRAAYQSGQESQKDFQMGEMRHIVVVPYDPRWPEMFRREAAKISAVLAQELISIHHIGSTSIPGLSAKPIIDIMPVVRNIEKVEIFNSAMGQLGYEARGENGIPGRRYFRKGGDASRTHHVHTYEPTNPEVRRHLDFRDYLIAHPKEAQQYASLKTALAQQFPHDINGYMAGKDAFIREIIQKAHKWRGKQSGGTSMFTVDKV